MGDVEVTGIEAILSDLAHVKPVCWVLAPVYGIIRAAESFCNPAQTRPAGDAPACFSARFNAQKPPAFLYAVAAIALPGP